MKAIHLQAQRQGAVRALLWHCVCRCTAALKAAGVLPEFYGIGGLYRDLNWNGACVFTPWAYDQWNGDLSVRWQRKDDATLSICAVVPPGIRIRYCSLENGKPQPHTASSGVWTRDAPAARHAVSNDSFGADKQQQG